MFLKGHDETDAIITVGQEISREPTGNEHKKKLLVVFSPTNSAVSEKLLTVGGAEYN